MYITMLQDLYDHVFQHEAYWSYIRNDFMMLQELPLNCILYTVMKLELLSVAIKVLKCMLCLLLCVPVNSIQSTVAI